MTISKPVLTFVVGVTGHRSFRLKDEHRSRIALQLADVCGNIEAECQAQLNQDLDHYAEPQPRLQLISSLADGADAMAVEQCPETWTVAGILPLPESDYVSFLRDTAPPADAEQAIAAFTAARRRAARVATLPAQDTSELARSRDFLLRQIDVLLAVWDGSPPDLPGGTADVVDHAAAAGIPVIWIAADRVQKAWVISSIDDANREGQMADATSGPIAEMVRRELGVSGRHPPLREPWNVVSHDADPAQRLGEFLKEDFRAASDGVTLAWASFLAALPVQDEFSKRVQDILLPRFAVADALATQYGRRYRLAYICVYLISACAVAAAVAGFVLFGGEHHETVPIPEVGLATLEFFLVALIVAIVWHGRRKRWHDRWLDYRALAETLRHLRFLAPLGQYEKRAYLESAARPGAAWMLWYFRATMRELGMPTGDLGPDYQRRILNAVVASDLEPQIDYHLRNLKMLRQRHRALHTLGDICFGLALVILILFLGAWIVSVSGYAAALPNKLAMIAPYVTACTAFLPALGAAFAGIRFTGDFEGFAERSAQTGSQLESLRQRYDVALDRLDFDISAGVVFESARIMAADINGWTSLYSRKHLTLPG